MPTVRLLAPPGVAQVGARGEPNPLAVVDSALLFRVSNSPASALVLDQSSNLPAFAMVSVRMESGSGIVPLGGGWSARGLVFRRA
jgi:hypothetical protein